MSFNKEDYPAYVEYGGPLPDRWKHLKWQDILAGIMLDLPEVHLYSEYEGRLSTSSLPICQHPCYILDEENHCLVVHYISSAVDAGHHVVRMVTYDKVMIGNPGYLSFTREGRVIAGIRSVNEYEDPQAYAIHMKWRQQQIDKGSQSPQEFYGYGTMTNESLAQELIEGYAQHRKYIETYGDPD